MRRGLIACAFGSLLSACVAGDKWFPNTRPALPTQEEVHAYVRAHWDDWVWHTVFARKANREGEAVALESLGPVSCRYLYLTPECTIEVTGKFASGDSKTIPMFSQFDRDKSGNLVEVLVMYHEVPR